MTIFKHFLIINIRELINRDKYIMIYLVCSTILYFFLNTLPKALHIPQPFVSYSICYRLKSTACKDGENKGFTDFH